MRIAGLGGQAKAEATGQRATNVGMRVCVSVCACCSGRRALAARKASRLFFSPLLLCAAAQGPAQETCEGRSLQRSPPPMIRDYHMAWREAAGNSPGHVTLSTARCPHPRLIVGENKAGWRLCVPSPVSSRSLRTARKARPAFASERRILSPRHASRETRELTARDPEEYEQHAGRSRVCHTTEAHKLCLLPRRGREAVWPVCTALS